MSNLPVESFDPVPNDAESFGTIRKVSESFRIIRNTSERKESHILSVRDVAKMFDQAGVPRTERSIINWCHMDRSGASRLDSYYDLNERKYFITPQSVELAIKEEQVRQQFGSAPNVAAEPTSNVPHASAPAQDVPHQQPTEPSQPNASQRETVDDLRKLRAENRRLKIEGEVSKRYIDKLEGEREKFIERMMDQSHQLGSLEADLKHYKELPPPRNAAPAAEGLQTQRVRIVEMNEETPAAEEELMA